MKNHFRQIKRCFENILSNAGGGGTLEILKNRKRPNPIFRGYLSFKDYWQNGTSHWQNEVGGIVAARMGACSPEHFFKFK
jgi:hypothetical protein